jgi:tripeptide aminopeptidase
MQALIQRFKRYAKINTRSDETSATIPSTSSQVEFAGLLAQDLKEIGLSEVEHHYDNGFVTATLPKNIEGKVPVLGFIAHIDTADFNSDNIQPRIIENYDGMDITLNVEQNIVMSVAMFPDLKELKGDTLITTDGTTLLGADDKAGVAEIIEAMVYLLNHNEIKHGEVRIAFGPDEEIGQGADHFDAPGFRADFAYTMDGSGQNELEYESFNAAQAKIVLHGVSVHPGAAKDKMINAAKLAIEFDQMLPQADVPEKTEGYEGFFHLSDMKAEVDEGRMTYILRDHDRVKFEMRKATILENAKVMNKKFGYDCVTVTMVDQYYNMGEVISKDMRPVDLALKAMRNLGIDPVVKPIRGGTDGSKISFMGIPTPNLFTGGGNYHGRYEYASVMGMLKAKETIIEIIRLNASRTKD